MLCVVGLATPASTICSPYEAILGVSFGSLDAEVRRAHMPPLHAEGTIDVEHGAGWQVRAIGWLMHLPDAGLRQPVRLDVVGDASEIAWTRCIGGSRLRTRQHARDSRLVERSGLGRISFDLAVRGGALLYRQAAFHVAGVPVPESLSPSVSAIVFAESEGWGVDVTVTWRGLLVCRYAGSIRAS